MFQSCSPLPLLMLSCFFFVFYPNRLFFTDILIFYVYNSPVLVVIQYPHLSKSLPCKHFVVIVSARWQRLDPMKIEKLNAYKLIKKETKKFYCINFSNDIPGCGLREKHVVALENVVMDLFLSFIDSIAYVKGVDISFICITINTCRLQTQTIPHI